MNPVLTHPVCGAAIAAALLSCALGAQIGPQPPDAHPVQLRLIEAGSLLQAEVDVASPAQSAVLLLSSSDALVSATGIVSPFLLPELMLPMPAINASTHAAKIPLIGLLPGAHAYLQAVVAAPGQPVLVSGIGEYTVGGAGPCRPRCVGYLGPPVRVAVAALTPVAPLTGSYVANVSATVPTAGWQLWHEMTLHTGQGTDLYLVLHQPVTGEPRFDGTDVSLAVGLGSLEPGQLRVFVAITSAPAPRISELSFGEVVQPLQIHE